MGNSGSVDLHDDAGRPKLGFTFTLQGLLYVVTLLSTALSLLGLFWGSVVAASTLAFWAGVLRTQNPARTLWIAIWTVAAIVGFWVMLPTVNSGRHPRGVSCWNNLRSITLAILTYEQHHGMLPPAFVADENGQPMRSWRALILPYLGESRLYKSYNFNEPWNGPHNLNLLNSTPTPRAFQCENPRRLPPGHTRFSVVMGDDTAWPGSTGRRLKEITDVEDTLLVVEGPKSVPWTSPLDNMTVNEYLTAVTNTKYLKSWGHRYRRSFFTESRCFPVVHSDGHVRNIGDGQPTGRLMGMLTVAGGEPVEDIPDAGRSWTRWDRVIACNLLGFLAVLQIFRVYRLTFHGRFAEPCFEWEVRKKPKSADD